MRVTVRPGRRVIRAAAAGAAVVLVALLAGMPTASAGWLASAYVLGLLLVTASDYLMTRRAWARAAVTMKRRLPPAFAIGVPKPVHLTFQTQGHDRWRLELHDHADASLVTSELPLQPVLTGVTGLETAYTVTPGRRGEVRFAPADVRILSRWGLCELIERLGGHDTRRVYPDFAQIARYAWLAGDRRLQEIGIKTYQQRGEGTDFKQLADYRVGDSVRHIDWRATLRMGKPIVREFQDERDQSVLILLDCGRRMRADDRTDQIGAAHFDQVLNAIMLLSYVALKQGDAVGALTFGTPPGDARSFAPRKGTELGQALRLLRSRHLVLLASLREQIVRELLSQPLTGSDAALDVASAHLYEQSRRDAFLRLSARDALMVDAEPSQLGIELVNRYHAVKRAGVI